MMRRYWPLILFVVVLVTPFVLRWALGLSAAPAGSASELRLIIVTAHPEGIKREYADAFSAWHQAKYGQPVYVDYRNYGGASDVVKFFQTSEPRYKSMGTYQIDLVWGGGDVLFEQQLKRPGYLQPVELDPALMRAAFPRPDLSGLPLYDQGRPPVWFGTALSSFGIVYNKDVCRHLGVGEPKTWSDLRAPRYAGWVVLADPTSSASVKQAFMIIVERAMADAAAAGRSEDAGWAEGMGLVRQISANARMFTDAGSAVPGIIGSGDAAAGMAIDFYGRSQVQAVGEERMGYVEPVSATAINPDPIGLVKGAEHRELAIRFIEFVLSEEGQRLWNIKPGAPGGPKQTALRRLPIRPSVYAGMSCFTDPVNPYAAAAGFNKSPGREVTFGIIGEFIRMSCMDLLEELQQTRQAILASPRAAELDARLGVFPFDQKEALRRAKLWKDASPVERIRLQREWTEDFRAEYRKLKEEAEGKR